MFVDLESAGSYTTRTEAEEKVRNSFSPRSKEWRDFQSFIAITPQGRYVPVVISVSPYVIGKCLSDGIYIYIPPSLQDHLDRLS